MIHITPRMKNNIPSNLYVRCVTVWDGCRTTRLTDPAPVMPGMQPRRNRGVRSSRFVMHGQSRIHVILSRPQPPPPKDGEGPAGHGDEEYAKPRVATPNFCIAKRPR